MNKEQTIAVIEYISRALTVIAYTIGGGAIIQYRGVLFDSYTGVGLALGLFVVLSGLYLFWKLVQHASVEMEGLYASKRVGAFYGGFLTFVAFTFFVAAFRAAVAGGT